MKRNIASIICLLSMICMAAAPVFAEDQVVFEDTMNTLNNWSKGKLITADETVDHAPYLRMGNGITFATLPRQIKTDWTLTADIRHTNFSRDLWLGLFDQDMKQGYALLWDSSLEKYFHGKGMFVILKVTGKDDDKNKGVVGFQSNAKRMGKPVEGPQLVKDPKFAHVKLTWEAATGKLTLSVNGDELQTVTDPDFKVFDRIVMRGNTDSLLDNVKVTQPDTK